MTVVRGELRESCKFLRYCEDSEINDYLHHVKGPTGEVRPTTPDDGIRLLFTLLRASDA